MDRGPTTARQATSTYVLLVDPTSGNVTQLTHGAPDGTAGFPRFTPFVEGGYYWLLFHSARPYGDSVTNPTTKQLWAMAIDATVTPRDVVAGVDPSHPAFWVPGQTVSESSIQGVWTRGACAGLGDACISSSACCEGLTCLPGVGGSTCDGDGCGLAAESCSDLEPCCAPFACRLSLGGEKVCQL